MLNVVVSVEGALGVVLNRSPELLLASDGPARGRGGCYRSQGSKPRVRLDALGHGVGVCVNERKRGGRKLPVGLVEVGADGGVVQSLLLTLLWGARGRMGGTGRSVWEWGVS